MYACIPCFGPLQFHVPFSAGLPLLCLTRLGFSDFPSPRAIPCYLRASLRAIHAVSFSHRTVYGLFGHHTGSQV